MPVLFLGLSNAFAASPLDPISVAIARFNSNPQDPVEYSYIGIRCASLNTMIGYAYEYQGDGSPKTKKMAKIFKDDGEMFNHVGSAMGFMAKISGDYMLKQFDSFLHIYGDEWTQSQKLNGTSWTPFIDSEVKSCETIKASFKDMSEFIDKNSPKK